VILADVNVLVYAFDQSSARHEEYRSWLSGALTSEDGFALVDTVLMGFVRIVTHPKIFARPSPTGAAIEFADTVANAGNGVWVHSSAASRRAFSELSRTDHAIRGNLVPDAYLASLAIANGASLATADRGFARYPRLRWFDPAAD
jgi:toxin-antitoxin system PIN domain toxin